MTAARRLQFGFLLIALVTVLLGVMAWANAGQAEAAAADVQRTNNLVKELEKLLSTLKDVEVAQREYLLTGDESAARCERRRRCADPHRSAAALAGAPEHPRAREVR
jgi:CHASE3 domain sensor protein